MKAHRLIISEHAIVWIEKLLDQLLEKLFLDTTLVHSLLSKKLYLQGLAQCVTFLGPVDLNEGVLNQVSPTPNLEHQKWAQIHLLVATKETSEQGILQLIVLCHLVFHLEHTCFACRVIDVRVVAKGEFATARALPPPEVLLQVEVLVIDCIIVEFRVWHRQCVGSAGQGGGCLDGSCCHVIGFVQELEGLGCILYSLCDGLLLVERDGDVLLQNNNQPVKLCGWLCS
mmetsp:Transcript_6451/g.15414  ORF Transcript_6451/g.15414 Transcript_6451/m.15414 type:complete len:228 (+) Transcript_6451:1264-1947(+)